MKTKDSESNEADWKKLLTDKFSYNKIERYGELEM